MGDEAIARKIRKALERAGYRYVRRTTHGDLYLGPGGDHHLLPMTGHFGGDPRSIRNQFAELKRKGIAIDRR